MPSFSARSLEKLNTCDERLQKIMKEAIKHVDFTILEGHRDEETQNEYFRQGKSKLKYPKGKHNSIPSKAIDVAPYPIDWSDTRRFDHLAGIIVGIGLTMGIKLRWGGDWDGDYSFKDQTFHDLPHFELKD